MNTKMTLKRCGLLILLCVAAAAPCMAQDYDGGFDVPFVPTPTEVVTEMLRIAEVGPNDILYDLGCGDGRIVITAASELGASGIGIDIDPERIEDSRQNAATSKVTDRVQFIQQDLFQAEIGDATVVSLYLLPTINLRLRPKLFSDLAPGVRVVSHNYHMGEWQPDRVLELPGEWRSHIVYYWIVPANVSGTWKWTLPTVTGDRVNEFVVNQQFQYARGTCSGDDTMAAVKDIVVDGDSLRFTVEHDLRDRIVAVSYEGRVRGNTIEGVASQAGYKDHSISWTAERDPGTELPIDVSEND